ncbi:hypothetical protein VSH64_38505 [Amycolatopsis rhabdoformis]|uniref:DUF1345 domain-containing protein n=1 Tax=Amycolatopsis rhabdoformis TaxID=1448059 RepID=A0ABZ1INY9_9PSEU|nr:hypothetical protein [Amycolatopsis rhabdoformis]WSE35346.1 hypothetical protein VSH64_38505 [Amycolatopsis rhabdoformis]
MPAWRRATEGETRWPAAVVVLGTLGLQLALPDRVVLEPWWLLPVVSVLLLVALLLINPGRMGEFSKVERIVSLVLLAVVSVTTAALAVRLVLGIVHGSFSGHAPQVLVSGAIVYWTNIVVFSLWYWEFDRGGPARRAIGRSEYPDLQFPQMDSPDLARADWEPKYADYLYLSFTNSTAFSPTDVMPMRIWTKLTMMVQAAVSLVLAVMVFAWAVGALRG